MLTTIDNIKEIRDISQNLKDGRIAPYIKEVEDAYVLPAIGAELYEKLDTGELEDAILLNGGYYDSREGRKYCHGLRLAVAYYAYARVLKNNQINVTAFGVVTKQTQVSSPANEQSITDASTEARKMGDMYMQSVIEYIHRDDKCGCGNQSKRGEVGTTKLHFQILN